MQLPSTNMAAPDNLRVISNPVRMRSISRAGFKMATVRRWLESRHVYVQNDWLEACIIFVREDNEVRKLCVNIFCNLTDKSASNYCIEYVGKAVVPCRAERAGV